MNEVFLAISDGCVCPGQSLTLVCTVIEMTPHQFESGGSTVWSGTSFYCPSSSNVITFLHNRFLNNQSESGECNSNNDIKTFGAQILHFNPDNATYTSQLNVTINSDLLGQNISCAYDDGLSIVTSSTITLTQKGTLLHTNNIIISQHCDIHPCALLCSRSI